MYRWLSGIGRQSALFWKLESQQYLKLWQHSAEANLLKASVEDEAKESLANENSVCKAVGRSTLGNRSSRLMSVLQVMLQTVLTTAALVQCSALLHPATGWHRNGRKYLLHFWVFSNDLKITIKQIFI